MQTAHELFLHDLSDMLDAERKLVDALGEQAEEASNPQLQKAFASHQAQTEKQVQRLEQIFEQLGEQPQQTECKGMKGLLEELETFKSEDPLRTFWMSSASALLRRWKAMRSARTIPLSPWRATWATTKQSSCCSRT